MYPNLYYVFKDLFGTSHAFFKLFQTFGFFVAVAFLAGAWVLTQELKRREKLGWLKGMTGMAVRKRGDFKSGLLWSAVIAFLIGYKVLGMFVLIQGNMSSAEVRELLLSTQGSLWLGIATAAVVAGIKWVRRPKDPEELKAKEWKEEVTIMPHQRVPDFTVLAALAGLIGAKIFHNLENWSDFVADPWGSIFSASGLTFYGGLILAAVVIIYYARKRNISTRHLIDSAAPALMLAYAIGRMGCHFSGDGDWGILNNAYAPDSTGVVQRITDEQYQQRLHDHASFFEGEFGGMDKVHAHAFVKPNSLAFLPDWFFAYGYPHNVINRGMPMANCDSEYCHVLPVAVYPTPLYEIIACLFLFGILWTIRRRVTIPGVIFGIYLIFNGLERFFIEKIRVNTKYDLFGFHPTQAELISTAMVITGAVLIWYCTTLHKKTVSR
ncbi:prolipoprotein diacylglyceryl transferase [Chitinophaga horti]|uniref:Prolipoprotein diacylglyceryl transferase n=1 Tax=Chitinophaga horti TaxID=2920382 RepID=A0ABY6J3L7_9BACT|nr:prolipoprotein diacylglyceryl transferase [Chitinophaga horti]UYQ94268.1 prolipoprotein diacylglyceryl transferase [Chitinophaga horti]